MRLSEIRERCEKATGYAWSPEDRLIADCFSLLDLVERATPLIKQLFLETDSQSFTDKAQKWLSEVESETHPGLD